MSREVGNEAETTACETLLAHGYKILERNYSCRFGEIDIIAIKDNCICFIEVKYRSPRGYGTAIDAITSTKMRKILKTARQYLFDMGKLDEDYRIDAVLINDKDIEIITNLCTQGMHDVPSS